MESATRKKQEGGYSVAPAGALRAHRYLPRVPSCREGPLPARSKLDELLGRGPAAKLLARSGTSEHREFKLDKKYQRPQGEEACGVGAPEQVYTRSHNKK